MIGTGIGRVGSGGVALNRRGRRDLGAQQWADLGGARRSGEQEALAELAAELEQALELARLLDPLGDDRQPERAAERDDRAARTPIPSARGRRGPMKSRAILRMSTRNRRR